MPATHLRAYGEAGQVLQENNVPASQRVTFTSDEPVALVVFYEGPMPVERVVGAIEVGRSGKISLDARTAT